jgi:hypothetical protein
MTSASAAFNSLMSIVVVIDCFCPVDGSMNMRRVSAAHTTFPSACTYRFSSTK